MGPLVGYAPGGWDMFHIGHLNMQRRRGSSATASSPVS